MRELQDLANAATAVQAQAAGTGTVTMDQLGLLGVTDRSGNLLSNSLSSTAQTAVLNAITSAADNGIQTDTVGKIQALLGGVNHAPVISNTAMTSADGITGVANIWQALSVPDIGLPSGGEAQVGSVWLPPEYVIDPYSDTWNNSGPAIMDAAGAAVRTYGTVTGTSLSGGAFEVLSGTPTIYFNHASTFQGMATLLAGLQINGHYSVGFQWQDISGALGAVAAGSTVGLSLGVAIGPEVGGLANQWAVSSSPVGERGWHTATLNFTAYSTTMALYIDNWAVVGSSIAVDSMTAAQTQALNAPQPTDILGARIGDVVGAGSVNDVDTGSSVKGYAVTSSAADAYGHHWQYTTDGYSWVNMDSASLSRAIYLGATDKVRWTGFSGTNTELDAKAVDDTGSALHGYGAAATIVDASVSGGNTAYSAGTAVLAANAAPIVLDLNRDGHIDYSHITMDMDAQQVDTAWAGPADGILVWNKFGDGQVHDSSQYVFGQNTGSDLSGLALMMDANHDGVFNVKDAQFAQFAVWQDGNQNGVVDAGEFHTLAQLGITSISLVSDNVSSTPTTGVKVNGHSTATLADGSSMLVADATFSYVHTAVDSTLNPAPFHQPMIYPAHVL